jgi:hypothetical protein
MSNRNSKILLITLFLIAFILRLTRILPNFEFVTTAMVISATYLSRKHSALLILAIMIATDLILGNTSIFLFTWSGFLLPILLIPKLSTINYQLSTLKSILIGLTSNLFFYVWTNFGVWALDSWNMYPKTMAGLISCYINGLPFLKTQLQSTIIFIPITLVVLNTLKNHYPAKTLNIAK